ncbi:pyridoxamine 5'-phosphate oxidase family protein [Novosphingobium sp. MW5]|nr:pyridoxamine 5'-phosphate oxidase family protein [Novosphingobium sp. MW5]
MPSRRDLIRMSDAESLEYLRGQCKTVLGTIDKDGMPHMVTLYYGVDPEGRIVISSFAKAQKVVNCERDPRATITVESGDTYHEIKSVMAQCNVEIIRDFEPMRAAMQHIRSANPRPHTEEAQKQIRASYAKRVVLRLTPYRFISWDHSKLEGKY